MKRFKLDGEEIEGEQMNMADNLMLLSRGSGGAEESDGSAESLPGQVFECKTCNRQFTSFRALGGHRASHKKPRLLAHNQGSREGSARKPKVKIHECSICGLEFSIGQALGGHMRRHRGLAEKKPDSSSSRALCFDLNLLPTGTEIESRTVVRESVV